jgi:sensor histidine kinase regulating citrate/malate metabolism
MTDKMSHIQQLIQLDRSQYQTVAVKSVVTAVVDERQEVHSNAEITTSLPKTAVGTVPSIVTDAVAEAIDNAVTAVATGEPAVTVAVSDIDDDWVEIEIRDTGPGIPEMEASVLETGEQTPLSHGGGVGVCLIRMLVKEAGGNITVTTTDGGTTLRFQLPKGKPKQTVPA